MRELEQEGEEEEEEDRVFLRGPESSLCLLCPPLHTHYMLSQGNKNTESVTVYGAPLLPLSVMLFGLLSSSFIYILSYCVF